MKGKTLRLLFYLKRGAKSKAGKSPIMARLSVGRTMVQFSCKTACSPSLWDSRKHRLVGKSAEAVAVNAELDSLQVSVCRAYEDLRKKQGEAVTAEEVKALVFGLQSNSQGLLYHLEEYLARFRERVGVDRSERRYKFLRVFRGHLAAFLRHRYRVSDFPVHKADKAFIEDLEAYFTQEKAFKLNTTAGYLTVLASLLKDLYKRRVIDTYPFMGYSIRWDVGTPRYITKEELRRIIDLDDSQLECYCASVRPTLAGEVYLTGEEVCERLKFSARTLQEYRSRGLLVFYKIGGKILYKQSDLQGCLTDIITPFKSHRYDDRRTTARQIGRQTGREGRHGRLCQSQDYGVVFFEEFVDDI